MVERWEYVTDVRERGRPERLHAWMNHRAGQGWRLVQALPSGAGDLLLVWERSLQEQAEGTEPHG